MTTTASSIIGDPASSWRLPASQKTDGKSLGQDQFLQLMLTQFRNQDPLKPQDPGEFLTQLAQVTSVTGISEMNKSMATLADSLYAGQALQAATVVGRHVLAPAESARLAEGGAVAGAIDLPVSTAGGYVRIVDGSGALVRELPLGARAAGLAAFEWDGRNATGTLVAPGTYGIVAGYRNGDEEVAANAYVARRATSVSLGGDGRRTEITTDDGTRVALGDIRAIY